MQLSFNLGLIVSTLMIPTQTFYLALRSSSYCSMDRDYCSTSTSRPNHQSVRASRITLRIKVNKTAHRNGLILREVDRLFGSLQTFEML